MSERIDANPVELVKLHLAAEDRQDVEAAMAPFCAEPRYVIPSLGIAVRGRPAVAKRHSELFEAFPDLRNSDVRCCRAEHRVFARIRVERTYLGQWGPCAPTGRRVITEALAEFPLAGDGRLEAEIVHINLLDALEQIGAVPTAHAFELVQESAGLRARETSRGDPLQGSCALVLGASRGIGAAIVRHLNHAGAGLAVAGRSERELRAVASQLFHEIGRQAHWICTDIADPKAATGAVVTAHERLGSLDILINNAGVTARADATELSLEQWDNVLATNLRGTFLAGREAARTMIAARRGSIVNIASLSSHFGIRRAAAYGASKGDVAQRTRALALEWGPL